MGTITLDFETEKIRSAPYFPPRPIGVALKYNEAPGMYLSWGHGSGNNCTEQYALETLSKLMTATYNGDTLLMHNAKFDWHVLSKLGFQPNPDAIRDTMIEAVLFNPYEKNLGLKSLAVKYLNMPAEEKDALGSWLLEHGVSEDGGKLSASVKSGKYFMGYLDQVPGDLASPYAVGDVDRTYFLHQYCSRAIETMNMGGAYRRELQVMPLLMESEKTGVRVDREKLEQDHDAYGKYLEYLDCQIRSVLRDDNLNIDSDVQLIDSLLRTGFVKEADLVLTSTGKFSAAKGNLSGVDPKMRLLLAYRSKITTSIRTFMEPWIEMASECGGLIYTQWNQVRGEGGGAKTGRLSSTPNLQNIPKFKDKLSRSLNKLWYGDEAYENGLAPIPNMRSYIVPWDKDWALIGRDYSQQEIRIIAHFGGAPGPGLLLQKYAENPAFDLHNFVHDELKYKYGREVERDLVKVVNFCITYGGGVGKVQEILGCSKEEARSIRSAVLDTNIDLKYLYETTNLRDRMGEPIRTWGGRVFYTEPEYRDPKTGRTLNFAYRLVNTLIQGSAAECTKEAWINLGKNTENRITYFTVHDEFLLTCTVDSIEENMFKLRKSMESVPFSIKMASDGKCSFDSWGSMIKYKDST